MNFKRSLFQSEKATFCINSMAARHVFISVILVDMKWSVMRRFLTIYILFINIIDRQVAVNWVHYDY